METFKKITLTAAYGAGTLAVAALLLLAAAGPECVLFPEAMPPMELRELASAWLAIGFLPMMLVSAQFYKLVRRRAVFLPSAVCLAAILFWVGVWTAGMVRHPASAAGGDVVLPEAENIEAARLTGSELDLTIGGEAFVAQLIHRMSQAKDTGRPSIQDVPDQGAGTIRIDLYFKRIMGKGRGKASTVFLYREGEVLLLEQPYQGIYRVSNDLEPWLREQIAATLAEGMKE